MIRLATLEDLPQIVELGRVFVASTILDKLAPYDPHSAWQTITFHVENDNAAVFVLEIEGKVVGFIHGQLTPLYWNYNLLAAQQFGWFVHPDFRGFSSLKLLKSWEAWARNKGATVFHSGAKKTEQFDKMNDMLVRQGYVELESIHIKGVA